jgi:futalosine hydrolase
MALNVLLVVATDEEAEAFRKIPEIISCKNGFLLGRCEISLLVAGVGSTATSWAMTKWLSSNRKPDLAINIGIAGSFRDDILIGDVVVPVSDCFANEAIETEYVINAAEETSFAGTGKFPFTGGKIVANNKYCSLALQIMRPASAITVNSATGTEAAIEILLKKYNPHIETMEGATFFYLCSGGKLPFMAIRSISNKVEPRNKDKWNIPLALINLSEKLKEFLLMI